MRKVRERKNDWVAGPDDRVDSLARARLYHPRTFSLLFSNYTREECDKSFIRRGWEIFSSHFYFSFAGCNRVFAPHTHNTQAKRQRRKLSENIQFNLIPSLQSMRSDLQFPFFPIADRGGGWGYNWIWILYDPAKIINVLFLLCINLISRIYTLCFFMFSFHISLPVCFYERIASWMMRKKRRRRNEVEWMEYDDHLIISFSVRREGMEMIFKSSGRIVGEVRCRVAQLARLISEYARMWAIPGTNLSGKKPNGT